MIALLALAAPSLAATLTVDPSDSAAYSTISSAIEAAASGDGISVVAGTFKECFDTGGKDLTITGAGSSSTKLDGKGSCANAVTIQGGETVSISGFQVKNSGKRGLYLANSNVSMDDLIIKDAGSTSINGGGVYVDGGTVSLANSEIDGNSAYYGANLYATGGATIDLTDTTISDGTAYYGGGLALFYDSTDGGVILTLTRADFNDNAAWYGGAALFVDSGATLTSTDSTFIDNTIAYYGTGGAIAFGSGGSISLDGDSFTDNGAGTNYYYGGAIALDAGTLTATGISFSGNSNGVGGSIYATESSVDLTDCSFEDGYASYGGAIYLSGSDLVMQGGSLKDNESYYSGGAIYATASSSVTLSEGTVDGNFTRYGYGGAVYANSYTPVTITGSTVTDNAAYYSGGAVYIYYSYDTNTFTDTEFSNNTADIYYGGAIAALYYNDVVISGSSFDGNLAAQGGGAVASYYYADTEISESTFTSNQTTTGNGGAVATTPYGGSWGVTIMDSAFLDNIAGTAGGGLSVYYAGALKLRGSVFQRNATTATGGAGGGLYVYYNSEIEVTQTSFCANSSENGGGAYTNYTTGAVDAWTNNVFMENTASYGGGFYGYNSANNAFINNDFLGNGASVSGGGLYLYYVYSAFTNNIVAWTTAGDGLVGDYYSNYYGLFGYNDWYENESSDLGGSLTFSVTGQGNTTDAPGIQDYTLDGDCDNDDLTLESTSPLRDAGDPALLDQDGSISDIGTYGGPDALQTDQDGDGYWTPEDCDDSDPLINPDGTEACDGEDNDCDGEVDEEDAIDQPTWYADADGDGFGDPASSTTACDQPSGYTTDTQDCDDTDASVAPGAPEIAYDGVDQDCDGADLVDVDGDGWEASQVGGEDCDDANPAINPDTIETWYDGVDSDCSGTSDYDADLDDYDSNAYGGLDCDDADPTIHPGAEDGFLDDIDQDCSGIDGDSPGAATAAAVAGTIILGKHGCACSAAPGSSRAALAPLFLLGLALLRRRRG